jgi:hypothetical protein
MSLGIMRSFATQMRYELRKVWNLPEEGRFRFTGSDWFLHLVSSVDDETRDKTLHAWHHRNDVLHGKGIHMQHLAAKERKKFGKVHISQKGTNHNTVAGVGGPRWKSVGQKLIWTLVIAMNQDWLDAVW